MAKNLQHWFLQSPNQKVPDRKSKCVIETHLNIKQNVILGECNSNSVWFLFRLNLYKYNFFFLDLQMLLKAVFGCVQGRRGTSRLYTLAHIWEVPFLCV